MWGSFPFEVLCKCSAGTLWIAPPVDVFLTYLWGKVNHSFSSSAILTSYLFLNFSTSCSEKISGDLNIYSKHSINGTERFKKDHDWCKMDPRMQTIKLYLSNSFHRMIVRPDVSWCYIKKRYMIKLFMAKINLNNLSLLQNLSELCATCMWINKNVTFPILIWSRAPFPTTFEELMLCQTLSGKCCRGILDIFCWIKPRNWLCFLSTICKEENKVS